MVKLIHEEEDLFSSHSMSAPELEVSSLNLGVEPRTPDFPCPDVDFFGGVSSFPAQLEHKPGGQQRLLNDVRQCLWASC